MKKTLLTIFATAILAVSVSAQNLVKHFTKDDDVASWWVNTGITPGWETVVASNDSAYILFTANLEGYPGDTLKSGYWATDLKFEGITEEQWNALKSDFHMSFWINSLDGENANDSINFCFEIFTDSKNGWPNIKSQGSAGKWTWVSLSLKDLDFKNETSGEIKKPADLTGVTSVKFSPQPAKNYVAKDAAVFTYAVQDITLSSGAVAAPAKDPEGKAYNPGGGTAVKSVATESNMFFPNPAKGNIYFNNNVSGQIIDLSGKVLKSFNNVNSVDINSVATGVYFIKVNNQVEKLMVK